MPDPPRPRVVDETREPSGSVSPPGTLAARLNQLFLTVHPRNRGEYSAEEVATAIRAMGGDTISGPYIWQLRRGVRDNPTRRHLEALAEFFGVPVAYFFDDQLATQIETELEFVVSLRESSVRAIATRMAGLSPGSLRVLAEMVEQMRRLEGLPDAEEEPWHPSHSGAAASSFPTLPTEHGSSTNDAQDHDDARNGHDREEQAPPAAVNRRTPARVRRG